jgi:cbb3-type cytochrome oxidase maturation protein
MDIVYLLIPLSVVLVFAIGAVLFWAIARGQFDDIDREGESIIATPDSDPVPGHAPKRP